MEYTKIQSPKAFMCYILINLREKKIAMDISPYIINDVGIQPIQQKIKDIKNLFNEFTYSHIPVESNGSYVGCISENDVRCFENDKNLGDYQYSFETFFLREKENWLDALQRFATNNTNIMPVLADDKNDYLGYIELSDVMTIFNETPFLSEPGGIIVVEKGINDYSFSEVSQIVESNEGKILGSFISGLEKDIAQITIKTDLPKVNEIIQTFRRYGYKITSSHQEDKFFKSLKERSDYLNKYLNI